MVAEIEGLQKPKWYWISMLLFPVMIIKSINATPIAPLLFITLKTESLVHITTFSVTYSLRLSQNHLPLFLIFFYSLIILSVLVKFHTCPKVTFAFVAFIKNSSKCFIICQEWTEDATIFINLEHLVGGLFLMSVVKYVYTNVV